MYTLQLSGFILRRVNRSYAHNGNRLASACGQCKDSVRFSSYRKRIGVWVKQQSEHVVEACTKQFEFIIAQRIRRSIQIFHLYTRIWDEVALREFLKAWRRRLQKNTKHYLLGAVGVAYNWDDERISDNEVNSYKNEIRGIHKLMDSTVVCAKCNLRRVIDICQPGIKYCKCTDCQTTARSEQMEGWQPFIEREDMLIWRKEEPNSGGLFAYKVYGRFADVTADDFLQVQIDVDYRREWDSTARELEILETDPNTNSSRNESTDIIYWEMIWPRLFANRDYVYQRRWILDRDEGLIVIISKVTEHPKAPARPGVYRVTSYWSFMVIRPYTDFHKPGIEFGLTYFDDPGVSIPSAVRAWVAMTGVPDFLIRMRQASKNYKQYKLKKLALKRESECNDVCENVGEEQDTKEENPRHKGTAHIVDRRPHGNILKRDTSQSHRKQEDVETETPETPLVQSSVESTNTAENSSDDKDKSFLNYFFLTKLFP